MKVDAEDRVCLPSIKEDTGGMRPLSKTPNQALASARAPSDAYKGFIAGAFSGITKLCVGHPFDTIKVRLQTSNNAQFNGPLQCLAQTVRNEGVKGLYKGATPPLVGWMLMDSVMLGSLTLYRQLLKDHVFAAPVSKDARLSDASQSDTAGTRLPVIGHGVAGVLAGWTVSFIAAPVEHVKARLQIQYAAAKSQRLYSGPIDCVKKIVAGHGIRGLYQGLSATLIFRTCFMFMWGSYEVFTRLLASNTNLSTPAINFWAGGLSAQVFWLTSYPSDVVKQRIMTDELGHGRIFRQWQDAALTIYRESGYKGYWRGFTPCFLRAFPANAMALVAFEGVMRTLKHAE